MPNKTKHIFKKFHPDWIKYIEKEIKNDAVLWPSYSYSDFLNTDTAVLLKNHLFDSVTFYTPHVYLCVDEIYDLLYYEHYDLVKAFLKTSFYKHKTCFWLIKTYFQGEKEKAYKELKELSEDKNNTRSDFLLLFAYAYKLFFNDDSKAKHLLEKAESMAATIHDKRDCIKAWLCLFYNKDEAHRCFTKILNLPKSVNEEIVCASIHYELFNDKKSALQNLEKVELIAQTPLESANLAKTYWMLFFDLNKAKILLNKAMKLKGNFNTFVNLSEYWMLIFKDEQKALLCFKKAESLIKYNSDLLKYAQKWSKLFTNLDEIKALLDRDFEFDNPADIWIARQLVWLKVFNNKEKYKECKIEEKKAREAYYKNKI